MNTLRPAPLTAEAFAPFGDVLEVADNPLKINAGMCDRHHDLADIDILDGRAGISFFKAQPRALPYQFDLVERHPKGSQAFIPMSMTSFLVIVAPDEDGKPGTPLAFLTRPGQGINLHRNTWHGVLTPLAAPGLFAVVDRIGDATNLQEYTYTTPFTVEDPNQD
ncbi:ureidoglycolate lyase [Cognatishimia maritima]|uniref:Ureidoglycolate lyase n=1 Tax=Cognatishimia maritima TaxID=870908 RepID=A0A1M5U4Z9_9RHOB|nr:ureidoglycolate lyase [Cognatishimia maritima]SHH58102.1 ureidoglycolate lyase [Cognatishimia maritima]